MDEDNSVLKSLFAQITGLKSHFRVDSETRIHQIARERRSLCKAMSRPSSGIRFAGFESFDEVRRGFEFTDERPALYPSPAATRRVPLRQMKLHLASCLFRCMARHQSRLAGSFDYRLSKTVFRRHLEDLHVDGHR